MLKLGMSPSRLKAFLLHLGNGPYVAQARSFLSALALSLFLEEIDFFFKGYGDHRTLHGSIHSFPTRRSSDLGRGVGAQDQEGPGRVARQRLRPPVEVRPEDRKSTRLNSSHIEPSRMPSSA